MGVALYMVPFRFSHYPSTI